MKVNIKVYKDKDGFNSDKEATITVERESIGDAIKYCKEQIKGAEGFVGFRVETLRGELKHKLHNN